MKLLARIGRWLFPVFRDYSGVLDDRDSVLGALEESCFAAGTLLLLVAMAGSAIKSLVSLLR